MNNRFLLLSFITLSLQAMQHVPALFIFNGSSERVSVSVKNNDDTKSIAAHSLNPGDGIFAYHAATIDYLLVTHAPASKHLDIQSLAQYQILIDTAQKTNQYLCITITDINPITLSSINLCTKVETAELLFAPKKQPGVPFVPRLLIKNNNWISQIDIEVKLAPDDIYSTRLRAQKIVDATHLPYNNIIEPELEITNGKQTSVKFDLTRIWNSAKQADTDAWVEVTTDWFGQAHIKEKLITRQYADKLLTQSEQPSYLAQLYARMIQIKQRIIDRLTARFADTAQ